MAGASRASPAMTCRGWSESGSQQFADEAAVDVAIIGNRQIMSEPRGNARLERITGLIDWSRIDGLLEGIYASATGRPAYPPLVLLKVLLLQGWYGLSDPGMEEALGDRLSFRRFVGLGLEEAVPDHSTISRFRTLPKRVAYATNGAHGQEHPQVHRP